MPREDRKDKKRRRKREDLEMVQALLQLSNLQKRQPVEQQLLQEQLQGAVASRTQQAALSPLQLQMLQGQLSGASDERQFQQQLRPLQLEEQRGVAAGRQADAQFAQQSLQDRLKMVGLEAQGRQLQNDSVKAVLPYAGQSAFLDNALKTNQSQMFPLQRRAMEAETKARNQAISQEDDIHSMRLRQGTVNEASQLQQIGMMQQQPVDALGYLKQRIGLQLPQTADPNAPGVSQDRMLNSGIMGDVTSRGGREWLTQNLPALTQYSQGGGQGGPLTQQLMELQNNPEPYGMTQFDPRFLTPEMLQQVQSELQKRTMLNR